MAGPLFVSIQNTATSPTTETTTRTTSTTQATVVVRFTYASSAKSGAYELRNISMRNGRRGKLAQHTPTHHAADHGATCQGALRFDPVSRSRQRVKERLQRVGNRFVAALLRSP